MQNSQFTILACDIGGTNVSLAIIQYDNGAFTTMETQHFQSRQVSSMSEVLQKGLGSFKSTPQYCCISAAGPIENDVCYISNLSWNIYRHELEEEIKIPVKLINDFTAIACSLPLLAPEQITPITDKGTGDAQTYVVVGAGTGLGIGAIMRSETGGFIPIASEGGHADLLPVTSVEKELFSYWQDKVQTTLEAEFLVSGPGLQRIFQFWVENKRFKDMRTARRILAEDITERPALISSLATEQADCKDIISCFLQLYGKVAANACLYFSNMPALFIGGGIITKITSQFLNDPSFLQGFYRRQHPKMREYLHHIPISLIIDYRVSLLGAAHTVVLDIKRQQA